MSKTILPFALISQKDIPIAGGKGASLGELTQAGINVPPGFVIIASVFDDFLQATDLEQEVQAQLRKVNYQDINSIEGASVVIRDLIHTAEFPKDLGREILKDFNKLKAQFVAVRSSATAEDSSASSWAGELETYLNTGEKTLLENIKKCWSSLFTPRAIMYRNEKGMIQSKVSVAVAVQKMIQSDVAGVCFTVHPVTKDKRQMIIEAGFGLGESIVSGQITPDSYVLDKNHFTLIDVNISRQERGIFKKASGDTVWRQISKSKQNKQKLSQEQISELAKLCVKIEKHYKLPQDIEWGIERGKLYILQSRPITTL